MSGAERLRHALRVEQGAGQVLKVEAPASRPVRHHLNRLRVQHAWLRACLDMDPVPLDRIQRVERTMNGLATCLRQELDKNATNLRQTCGHPDGRRARVRINA